MYSSSHVLMYFNVIFQSLDTNFAVKSHRILLACLQCNCWWIYVALVAVVVFYTYSLAYLYIFIIGLLTIYRAKAICYYYHYYSNFINTSVFTPTYFFIRMRGDGPR